MDIVTVLVPGEKETSRGDDDESSSRPINPLAWVWLVAVAVGDEAWHKRQSYVYPSSLSLLESEGDIINSLGEEFFLILIRFIVLRSEAKGSSFAF
jgi:hypothetical protein